MAIMLRDQHLEEQIDKERERRGDATMAKTLGDLVREKLIELTRDRQNQREGESTTRRESAPAA